MALRKQRHAFRLSKTSKAVFSEGLPSDLCIICLHFSARYVFYTGYTPLWKMISLFATPKAYIALRLVYEKSERVAQKNHKKLVIL